MSTYRHWVVTREVCPFYWGLFRLSYRSKKSTPTTSNVTRIPLVARNITAGIVLILASSDVSASGNENRKPLVVLSGFLIYIWSIIERKTNESKELKQVHKLTNKLKKG